MIVYRRRASLGFPRIARVMLFFFNTSSDRKTHAFWKTCTIFQMQSLMACDWGQNPKLEISFPRFKTGKKKNFFAWIHHSCSCQQAHERSHRNPPPHLLYFSSRPTHLRYRCGKEIEHLLPTTYYLRLAIVSVFLPLGSPARLHGPRRSDRVWFSWKKKKSRRFFLWNTWLKQQLH